MSAKQFVTNLKDSEAFCRLITDGEISNTYDKLTSIQSFNLGYETRGRVLDIISESKYTYIYWTKKKPHNFYISLFRIKYKHTCIYILIHLPIVKINNYSVHLNHMVSALRAVDSVFKLHVFHATAKTAYLKSIKLKVIGSKSTHLTNPVVISYEKCCCRMPRLSNDERNHAVTMLLQGATPTGSSNCSRCSSNYCPSSTGPSCTVWKH
jgi:hypothetical protein